MFRSTKKYGHEVGISCAFRQWKAPSHCRFLHGYALAFKFTFEADELDYRNWVVDFGGLKSLKNKLEELFDHKTIIAQDDPNLAMFEELEKAGACDLVIVSAVGIEKFAEMAYILAMQTLEEESFAPRCRVIEVEVFEHGANSAIFQPNLIHHHAH
jgi:6-pyruvoyltetrahydropterin/6-carboxytetrahydropterin synthase